MLMLAKAKEGGKVVEGVCVEGRRSSFDATPVEGGREGGRRNDESLLW